MLIPICNVVFFCLVVFCLFFNITTSLILFKKKTNPICDWICFSVPDLPSLSSQDSRVPCIHPVSPHTYYAISPPAKQRTVTRSTEKSPHVTNDPEEVCHHWTTQVPLAAPFTEVTDSQTAFRRPCFGAASFQDDDIHMQVTNKQLAHSEQATLFT